MTQTDDGPLGPLELMESARMKYSLALARLQRGPPELALLSLHGSLEDALRSHALRHDLPAAGESFPHLLNALTSDTHTPLSAAEAEGIRRMHRLRARVAHGEHLAVTAATIDAYHRLVARLLPRYGVMVVGPENGEAETRHTPPLGTESTPPRRRFNEVDSIPPRHGPERGKTTIRLNPPPRERSAYPGDEFARYTMRPRSGAEERAPQGGGVGRMEIFADRWRRSQTWVLPLLIIVSILLIGTAISISLQQLRTGQTIPTPAVIITALVPQPPPVASPSTVQIVNSISPQRTVVATELVATPIALPGPGEISAGRAAYVRAEVGALNVRERPGTNQSIPVMFVLQPGTRIDVVEGPIQADGLTWWKVRAVNQDGWCAGEYLEVR